MKTVPVPMLPRDESSDPPEDRAITRRELEALRHWLRGDAPAFDEAPELPAHLYDHEVMGPLAELSDDRGGFFGFGNPECG